MELYPIEKDGTLVNSAIDAFVDDTSLFTNLPYNKYFLETAIQDLQSATQLLAQSLEAVGRKLELKKYF